MKFSKGMEHIKPMHVYDCGVYTQLSTMMNENFFKLISKFKKTKTRLN